MLRTFLLTLGCLTTSAAAQCVEDWVGPATLGVAEYGATLAADGDRFLASNGAGVVELRRVVPGGATAHRVFRTPSGSGPDASFGACVALDGDTVAIGHPASDVSGVTAGAVHLYERGAGGWSLARSLAPADLGAGDEFGAALQLDGDRLVVGAAEQGEGAVYVFRRAGGAWIQEAKLFSPATATENRFGLSLALEDDVLAVGANYAFGGPFVGRVYVCERGAQGWTFTTQLTPSVFVHEGRFGAALALDDGVLAIGHPGRDGPLGNDSGVVVIHERALGWARTAELIPLNSASVLRLGTVLALKDGRLLAGTPLHSAMQFQAGGAYVFERTASGWRERAYLVSPNRVVLERFGAGVAIADSADLVGAPGHSQVGAVWVVDPNAPGGGTAYCPSLVNSGGTRGVLAYRGSLSVGTAWTFFDGYGLVPGELTQVFYGAGQQSVLSGDGLLCVTPPFFRLGTSTANLVGFTSQLVPWGQAPASAGPGALTAGSTWHFQMWYRDPPSASGWNLTSGLQLTFCP